MCIREFIGSLSGLIMTTPEKRWPKNQITYRNETAEWLQKGINELALGKQAEAMFSLSTALRWIRIY